jgi:hypothetical protein
MLANDAVIDENVGLFDPTFCGDIVAPGVGELSKIINPEIVGPHTRGEGGQGSGEDVANSESDGGSRSDARGDVFSDD